MKNEPVKILFCNYRDHKYEIHPLNDEISLPPLGKVQALNRNKILPKILQSDINQLLALRRKAFESEHPESFLKKYNERKEVLTLIIQNKESFGIRFEQNDLLEKIDTDPNEKIKLADAMLKQLDDVKKEKEKDPRLKKSVLPSIVKAHESRLSAGHNQPAKYGEHQKTVETFLGNIKTRYLHEKDFNSKYDGRLEILQNIEKTGTNLHNGAKYSLSEMYIPLQFLNNMPNEKELSAAIAKELLKILQEVKDKKNDKGINV